MAMSAKSQVQKILASKSFTGKQAAHLVMKDFVEVRHGRPNFLSATDISRLKQGLRGQEIDVYNAWIKASQLLDLSAKDATIMSLLIEKRLLALKVPILLASLSEGEQVHRALSRPILVTRTQLKDIEREHRENAANRLETFTDVVLTAAEDHADEISREYPEETAGVIREFLHFAKFAEEDALPGFSTQEACALQRELFTVIALRILRCIEVGRLTPFSLTTAELGNRKALTDRYRDAGQSSKDEAAKTLEAFEAEVGLRSLRRARPKGTAALVKRIRGALEDGSLSWTECPEWLEAVFFRGRNLIDAGPDWYAWWADHFEADRYQAYAVVLNPKPSEVDENGYFIEPENALLRGATRQAALEALDDRAEALHDAVAEAHTIVLRQLRHVLGYQAVIQAVSEAIGVDFEEDIEQALSSLASTMDDHNELLERVAGWHRLEGLAALKLNIESLKPNENVLDSIRERLNQKGGEEWWSDIATAMNRALEAAES